MKTYKGFDHTVLRDSERNVLIPALRECTFPLSRIKRRTGAHVPLAVSDLSRFSAALDPRTGHGHAEGEFGHAHLLGEPESRRAPLGLYWLPTPTYPAGRIEIGTEAMKDPDLAREVLLAEAAHAVDYGALDDAQRDTIEGLFDWQGAGDPPLGWFEEEGEPGYWRWRGERWMGLFMAAFAPGLPRPLERMQPWEWSYSRRDVVKVRRLLNTRR